MLGRPLESDAISASVRPLNILPLDGRQDPLMKFHFLMPGIHECVSLHGKENKFTDVIKDVDFGRWSGII